MKYIHIAQRVYNTPLAIEEGKLRVILDAISPRVGLESPNLAGLDASKTRTSYSDLYDAGAGVFVLEVNGSLVNRWATAPSGIQTYDQIRGMLRSAAANSAAKGVLLRIDSYGGEVSGIWDLLDEMAELAKDKPIWACVDDAACSAAYAIASQAEKIFVTRTGVLGSVGVIAVHYDFSGYLAKEGIKPTAVFAGARKADFSPDQPLSDEAKTRLRQLVDASYEQFIGYVSKGRNMDADKVRQTEALTYRGEDGIKAGFADQVGTFEEAIDAMRQYLAQRTVSGAQAAAPSASAELTEGAQMETPQFTAETQAAAVQAENARINGILGLEEAKGREAVAQKLAMTPGMTADQAKDILAVTPKASSLAAAMPPNPDVKQGAEGAGEDDVNAEVRKSLALAGHAPKEVK